MFDRNLFNLASPESGFGVKSVLLTISRSSTGSLLLGEASKRPDKMQKIVKHPSAMNPASMPYSLTIFERTGAKVKYPKLVPLNTIALAKDLFFSKFWLTLQGISTNARYKGF